jgi:hypothetical protein
LCVSLEVEVECLEGGSGPISRLRRIKFLVSCKERMGKVEDVDIRGRSLSSHRLVGEGGGSLC